MQSQHCHHSQAHSNQQTGREPHQPAHTYMHTVSSHNTQLLHHTDAAVSNNKGTCWLLRNMMESTVWKPNKMPAVPAAQGLARTLHQVRGFMAAVYNSLRPLPLAADTSTLLLACKKGKGSNRFVRTGPESVQHGSVWHMATMTGCDGTGWVHYWVHPPSS